MIQKKSKLEHNDIVFQDPTLIQTLLVHLTINDINCAISSRQFKSCIQEAFQHHEIQGVSEIISIIDRDQNKENGNSLPKENALLKRCKKPRNAVHIDDTESECRDFQAINTIYLENPNKISQENPAGLTIERLNQISEIIEKSDFKNNEKWDITIESPEKQRIYTKRIDNESKESSLQL